jgi:hypothetical protein
MSRHVGRIRTVGLAAQFHVFRRKIGNEFYANVARFDAAQLQFYGYAPTVFCV